MLKLKPEDEFAQKNLKTIRMMKGNWANLSDKIVRELPNWILIEELRRYFPDFELKDLIKIAGEYYSIKTIRNKYLSRLHKAKEWYSTNRGFNFINLVFLELLHRFFPEKVFVEELSERIYDLWEKLDETPLQKKEERVLIATEIVQTIISGFTDKGENVKLNRKFFDAYRREQDTGEMKDLLLFVLETFKKTRQWQKMLTYSEKLFTLFGERCYLEKMAQAYFGLKRYKDARKIYEDLMTQEPVNISYMIHYADFCLKYLKDKKMARKIYSRALFKVESGWCPSYEREDWINTIFRRLENIAPDQAEFSRLESQRVHLILNPNYRIFKKVGRNDPCPCGSGKKYKKCCGR